MNLNDLLVNNKIEPSSVFALRHSPQEPALKRVLPWLAAERHDLYNAFQQTQGAQKEASIKQAKYVASFIGLGSEQALFVGLYRIKAQRELSVSEYWDIPAYQELKALYGLIGFDPDQQGRTSCIWFDFERTEFLQDWIGRLVVMWPGGTRSWGRWADRNENMDVFCIHPESQFVQAMPMWHQLVLKWSELPNLPQNWKTTLSQWRGIYHIQDQSDGRGYVGSAYGQDNIGGRWQIYARTGHGGNKLLKGRDPGNFVFSILERVSPDMPADEVIALESSWKERLHTRGAWGLNEN